MKAVLDGGALLPLLLGSAYTRNRKPQVRTSRRFLKTSSKFQRVVAFESARPYFLTFGDGASECIAAGSLPSGDNPPFQPRCLATLTSQETHVAILLQHMASFNIMSETLPLTGTTPLQFENGIATGFS
ncbi:MAG: hypothetical protein VYE28_03885, partial [Planctomycetota bacterium]|nr:hypothetical protein [Planctomycetota bacterium]